MVFHGHGAGGEVDKALLERFLRQVDDGLREVLKTATAPLVLAAVDYEQAMFRQLTRYPHVLGEGIGGNPEQLRPAELHERAWAIVEPVFAQAPQQAAQRYQEAAGRGQGAVWAVTEVVRAALRGQVDTLFVAAAAAAACRCLRCLPGRGNWSCARWSCSSRCSAAAPRFGGAGVGQDVLGARNPGAAARRRGGTRPPADAGLASNLHGDAWHERASRNSPPSIANACAPRKRLP